MSNSRAVIFAAIKDALYVIQDGKKKTMRGITSRYGRQRWQDGSCLQLVRAFVKIWRVTATGSGISVPVGEKTLGEDFLTSLEIPLIMEKN